MRGFITLFEGKRRCAGRTWNTEQGHTAIYRWSMRNPYRYRASAPAKTTYYAAECPVRRKTNSKSLLRHSDSWQTPPPTAYVSCRAAFLQWFRTVEGRRKLFL